MCLSFFQLNETLSSKLVCNDKPIIPPVDNLNNKTGIIVPKQSIDALEKAIEKMLSDDKMEVEFGKNAKAQYLKFFTDDIMIKKTEKLYTEVLKRN